MPNFYGSDADDFFFNNTLDEQTVYYAGSGSDVLFGANQWDDMYGGHDDDLLVGDSLLNTPSGGDGSELNPFQFFNGDFDNSFGEVQGSDWLSGDEGVDAIYGGHGSDILMGGLGNDQGVVFFNIDEVALGYTEGTLDGYYLAGLYGGAGDDILDGGLGSDTLLGEDDEDTLFGGEGHDFLNGGDGDDLIYGGIGGDRIQGDDGAVNGIDEMHGDQGVDIVTYQNASGGVTAALDGSLVGTGAAAGDTFFTIENIEGHLTGADTLSGNSKANEIYGLGGADKLYGRDGADFLYGAAGADTLTGGMGADFLSGNTEGDIFRYNSYKEGGDTISTFSGADKFHVKGSGFGNLTAGTTLAASKFQSNTSGQAEQSNDRFIFETDTDKLWYDPDGTGGKARVLIADMNNNASIDASDIYIF